MKLIVDAGSTKAHWQIRNRQNEVRQIYTDGINLLTHSWEHIEAQIEKAIREGFDEETESLEIYAAGGIREEEREKFKEKVGERFNISTKDIIVESDLVLAAKALCGDKPGIACIMGTGSNSCLWNGKKIEHNVRPLGYILGDEGSGAVLGKKLIANWFKGLLSKETAKKLEGYVGLDYGGVMSKIYKEPGANKYLAGMTKFMLEHIEDDDIKSIVMESFSEFVERNLLQYKGVEMLDINFVGSIAYYFREQLEFVLDEYGLTLGKIMKEPLE